MSVGERMVKDIDHIYAYNPGFGPKQAIASLEKQALNKLGIKTKRGRIERELQKKLTIYSTGVDPISALAGVRGSRVIKPKSFNAHSLSNFTAGSWARILGTLDFADNSWSGDILRNDSDDDSDSDSDLGHYAAYTLDDASGEDDRGHAVPLDPLR